MGANLAGKNLRRVSCIAAIASDLGIGNNGKLPWPSLRTDLEFLQRITTDVREKGKWNAVLLGRKTWESLNPTQQPLPGRLNVVISKTLNSIRVCINGGSSSSIEHILNAALQKQWSLSEFLTIMSKFPPCGAHHVCDSVSSAVQMLSDSPFTDTVEQIFVLGGTEVYREAIESSYCYRIYLTEIDKEFESDTFFPTFDKNTYRLLSSPSEVPQGVIEENQIQYRFCVYEKQR